MVIDVEYSSDAVAVVLNVSSRRTLPGSSCLVWFEASMLSISSPEKDLVLVGSDSCDLYASSAAISIFFSVRWRKYSLLFVRSRSMFISYLSMDTWYARVCLNFEARKIR